MLTSNEKLDAIDAQARAARRLTGQMTHVLRQIRPRCSYGSAIWVEVTDAVCVDKVSRARARVGPPETLFTAIMFLPNDSGRDQVLAARCHIHSIVGRATTFVRGQL